MDVKCFDEVALHNFAKRLANNEPKMRNVALKKLRVWLHAKSGSFDETDFMKIWKGLHYCFWMADKPVFQEELAERISNLVSSFDGFEKSLLFFKCFLQTEAREWSGTDRLRLDKYMMLIRRMLRHMLCLLRQHGWKSEEISGFVGAINMTSVDGNNDHIPDGLRYHIIDIYVEELNEAGCGGLDAVQILQLVMPFCQLIVQSPNKGLVNYAIKTLFTPLIEHENIQINKSELADVLFKLASKRSCRSRAAVYRFVNQCRESDQLSADDGNVSMEEDTSSQCKAIDTTFNGKITRSLASEMNLQCSSSKVEQNKEKQAAENHSQKHDAADIDGPVKNGTEKKQKKKKKAKSTKESRNSEISEVAGSCIDDHMEQDILHETEETYMGKESKALKANKKRKHSLLNTNASDTEDLSADGAECQATRQNKRLKLDSRSGSEKNGMKNNASKSFALEVEDAEDVSDEEIEICIPHSRHNGPANEVIAKSAPLNSKLEDDTPQSKKSRKLSQKFISEEKPFLVFDSVAKTPAALVRRTLKTPNTEPQRKHLMLAELKQSLALSTGVRKKVKFAKNLTQAQDFEDSLNITPKPAFDPHVQPDKAILKSSSSEKKHSIKLPKTTPKKQLFKTRTKANVFRR